MQEKKNFFFLKICRHIIKDIFYCHLICVSAMMYLCITASFKEKKELYDMFCDDILLLTNGATVVPL